MSTKTDKTMTAQAPESSLPDVDEVLRVRDERAAAGSSTAADSQTATTKPKRSRRIAGGLKRGLRATGGKDGRGWRFLARAAVLIADYVLVTVMAFAIIPSLGAWMHESSGVAGAPVNDAGMIALWIIPTGFAALTLWVAMITVMRWMWRWASGVGRNIADQQSGILEADQDDSSAAVKQNAAAKRRRNQSKNKRKRSK